MKLDKIPKKEIFIVPEDYFQNLSLKIQARVLKRDTSFNLAINWKYAFASFAMLFITIFTLIFKNEPASNIRQLLCDANSKELILYLELNDIYQDNYNYDLKISDEFYNEIINNNFDMDLKILEEEIFYMDMEDLPDEYLEDFI